MAALENFFGKHEKYFAIDGGKFPPKALIFGTRDGVVYGITAGVSMIPMPTTEQYFREEELAKYHKIELGFAAIEQHRSLCELFYSTMSSLAAYPWQEITFFAHGHTVPIGAIGGFDAILFVNPKMVPELERPEYTEVPTDVILLWLIPITAQEYEFAMKEGSQALIEQAADLEKIHVFDGKPKFMS